MMKLFILIASFVVWSEMVIALGRCGTSPDLNCDRLGPFELNYARSDAEWAQVKAQVRRFLWKHWQEKAPAQVSINYTSREGVPYPVSYIISRASTGAWNLYIETRQSARDGEPMRRSTAWVLQRIVLRRDRWQPEVPVPTDSTLDATRYELLFKDDQGKVLGVL